MVAELTAANRPPVALASAPDGRLFYAEQFTGNIRVVTAEGEPQEEPFAQVDVLRLLEWALTGLAIDPDFETNHRQYICFTEVVQVPAIHFFAKEDLTPEHYLSTVLANGMEFVSGDVYPPI